jgi:hypothetical protein
MKIIYNSVFSDFLVFSCNSLYFVIYWFDWNNRVDFKGRVYRGREEMFRLIKKPLHVRVAFAVGGGIEPPRGS